ncbi:unnamed protein product [Fraxinus pennsylvanica]|uniref:Uncharacterized protein n=1 Tax=Fraxinus pennsylvanica TaxID=56036 RepID=A0AAD2E578_9LAMI|nr:unnamed protein product [Fraxinus pennsylvanica]
MAEANCSLLQENHLFNPKPLIVSQFSDSDRTQLLPLTTESFVMERGPRYEAYADLREKKLRSKNLIEVQKTPEKVEVEKNQNKSVSVLTPPKKQVKFQGNLNFTTPPRRPKESSVLTRSVPDFSSALRKENRKPVAALPPVMERSVTPPPAGWKNGKVYGKVGGGSKSVNSGEKKSDGLMSRKSYANMDELKGLAAAARNGINGGGRISRGVGKTVLGYRQF